jgi:hypothetical protein
MNSDELFGMVKAQSDAYLAAYNAGYEKGFRDACDRALEIVNKPKRSYTRPQEKTDGNGG